jgi:hypothetical protein
MKPTAVHVYEVRPRKVKRGDLISDALLAVVENTAENVYARQCQMNLRPLKNMFLMRLI